MQSQKRSMVEAICNTGSGMIISYFVWLFIIKPWIALLNLDLDGLGLLGIWAVNSVFTTVSVVRGWMWRRAFNKADWRNYERSNDRS
jgi:hypothetical protein